MCRASNATLLNCARSRAWDWIHGPTLHDMTTYYDGGVDYVDYGGTVTSCTLLPPNVLNLAFDNNRSNCCSWLSPSKSQKTKKQNLADAFAPYFELTAALFSPFFYGRCFAYVELTAVLDQKKTGKHGHIPEEVDWAFASGTDMEVTRCASTTYALTSYFCGLDSSFTTTTIQRYFES